MTIRYDGFLPGQAHTMALKPHPRDKGHSVVTITTSRIGDAFMLRHTAVCECGKVFSTKGGGLSAIQHRHTSHQRDQQ